MRIVLKLILCVCCILSSRLAVAQFYSAGDNPASVKWYQTETQNYKIIYPAGLDSLARQYGIELEKWRIPVGRTAGYAPGENINVKMPVVLHSYNVISNGSVAWAPKIINLFTIPQIRDAEAMPWKTSLTIHESRHAAQMQAGLTGWFKPFKFITGEMFNGLVAGLYSIVELLEGDAVVAETALTNSGRGRSSDFMNYFMIAYDHGDLRTWHKWRFGSQRHYTPTYYASGYMLLGGVRYLYDYRDITSDLYRHIPKHPFYFGGLNSIIKKRTGKNIDQVYPEIATRLYEDWLENAEERGPFVNGKRIIGQQCRYTEYNHNTFKGGTDHILAVKKSLSESDNLVMIDLEGREKKISAFAPMTSNLVYSNKHDRLYWSEVVSDHRWTQRTWSIIRYKHYSKIAKHNLTSKTRYFNPSLSPDEDHLAVTEYLTDGRSRVVILDALSGKVEWSIDAPDSLQIVENMWYDGGKRILATAISENGYGIYCRDTDCSSDWEVVLSPQPVKISRISVAGTRILFTSDLNGVNELYAYSPVSSTLHRITSTRYGATDFTFNENTDTLFYNAASYCGKIIHKIPVRDLKPVTVDFSKPHKYKMAEALSAQERELALKDNYRFDPDSVQFSNTKRHRKVSNLFNFHSWAPFYFNVDNIMKFSADHIYQMVSLGAAAISQNRLGTAVTHVGYSAHKDPYNNRKWRHSGHFKLTYSGWYPVIEAQFDINDRGARTFSSYAYPIGFNQTVLRGRSLENGQPYINGRISAYIPFNFSSGGWYRTLVPKVSWNISNDMFSNGVQTIPMQLLTVSVRGSITRPVANSGVYPNAGVGGEIGAYYTVGLEKWFSPIVYTYLYGYTPGFIPTHGLRLTALYRRDMVKDSKYGPRASINTLPRGLAGRGIFIDYTNAVEYSLKLTSDYAIPIYIGDLSIGKTFMHIQRLVLTPFLDYTIMPAMPHTGLHNHNLYSVGASFAVNFKSLFWLEFPFTVGLTYSYNGGRLLNWGIQNGSINKRYRHHVGVIFDIAF